MRISIWQQFGSNHSANYDVVGTFSSETEAHQAVEKFRRIFLTIKNWWWNSGLSQDEFRHWFDQVEIGYPTPIELKLGQEYGVEWKHGINDAVGELMGLNRYSYANNNPVNLTDPSGMIAERPPNTCSAWQSGGGLQTTDCVQTCMNSPEMVERQAYPNHVPINAIWQTCYNRCQIPSSYPQTGSCSPCQRKILAVSVANEVGGGGFEMALDVAHIHLNRLEDTRLGKPTIEDLIRGGQVSERLLTGFNGDCASDPTFGERVYNFYADPSSPLGLVGDVPKNIGVAEQAVNYACAAPQSDRTGGSLWFLVSNDASYISNQIDPSGQLK